MNTDSIRVEVVGKDIRRLGQSMKINTEVVGEVFTSRVERLEKSYQKDSIHNSQQKFVDFLESFVVDNSITKLVISFDCKDFYLSLKSGVSVEITEVEISSQGIVVTTRRSSISGQCIGDEITRESLEIFKAFSKAEDIYSHIADHFLSVTYYDLPFSVVELDTRVPYLARAEKKL
jgi:hypothetical protein